MKNKFIFVATLIFTVMLAMTAFATDTWKLTEDGKWFCYDKDENIIYGEVKKSGENYYYLDEATGEMVTNKLVEVDGYKYWFGADGAKVIDAWVQVPVEESFEWMYFKPVTGKAETTNNKAVTINGKKYRFTSDGYMQYGYLKGAVDTELTTADNVIDADWYFGPKTDGSAQTCWLKFVDGEIDAPGYDDKALVYFYFDKGKKVAGNGDVVEKKIDGVKYYFNEDGSLYTGYQTASGSVVVATGTYYLGKNDDGSMKKNQWVKTSEIKGGDDAYWYYLGKDGRVVTSDDTFMKKINDKFYLFASTGEMKTGLAVIDVVDYQGYNNPTEEDYEVTDKKFATVKEYKDFVANGAKIYYFSTDADNDGSMKFSKDGIQTITIDDETIDVWFDKHGVAYEGVVKDKIYNNGVLQTGIGVVSLHTKDDTYTKDYYLVNKAGKILKSAIVTDGEGDLWAVDDEYNIAKFADQDYKGKAATAWKNKTYEFVVNGKTYAVVGEDTGKGYYTARYIEVTSL